MPKLKILHLTPHLNGGLGEIIYKQLCSNAVSSYCSHYVALYEKSSSSYPDFLSQFAEFVFDVKLSAISSIIGDFDVVQVEYWNHPLVYKLLTSGLLDNHPLVGMCAHIQGNSPPQLIAYPALKYLDFALCTGLWIQDICSTDNVLNEKIYPFRYTVDTNIFSPVSTPRSPSPKNSLALCYVGTVSYSKLSRQFFHILNALSHEIDFSIVVVGDPHPEVLADSSLAPRINISFTGKVDNVVPYLHQADVFIYPLRRTHYGTGEIALLEAMSCGLPVVAFDNIAESGILASGETGLLCSSEHQFVEAIVRFANCPQDRIIFGRKARQSILANNSFIKFVNYLDNFYQTIISKSSSLYVNSPFRSYSSPCLTSEALFLSLGALCFLHSLQSLTQDFHDISGSMVNFFLNRATSDDYEQINSFFLRYPSYGYSSKGGLDHYLHVFPADHQLLRLKEFVE